MSKYVQIILAIMLEAREEGIDFHAALDEASEEYDRVIATNEYFNPTDPATRYALEEEQ